MRVIKLGVGMNLIFNAMFFFFFIMLIILFWECESVSVMSGKQERVLFMRHHSDSNVHHSI